MKKQLAVSVLLAGLTLGTSAGAMENDSIHPHERGDQEWHGMGAGALAGGMVAGPVGVVIGAVGGTLFGRTHALEDELERTQQQLMQLESRLASGEQRRQLLATQLTSNRQHQQQLEQALEQGRQEQSRQLDAITAGFAMAIHFRTGSAALESGYGEQIERLAASLHQLPELDLHVDGYSDVRGSSEHNRRLAQQRSQTVIQRLQGAGLTSVRIIERSYGEQGARYTAGDTEGLGLDRRVVLHLCRRSTQ